MCESHLLMDLKADYLDVCVSAALAAIKETVTLPWLLKNAHAGSDIPTPSLSITSGSAASGKRVVVPTTDGKQKLRSIHSSALLSADLAAASANRADEDDLDLDDDIPSRSGVVGTAPKRVLEWRHFEVALKEIRASASEDGTMPELRKVRLGSCFHISLPLRTCVFSMGEEMCAM